MDKRNEKILALAGGIALIGLIADTALATTAHLHVLAALLPYLAWSAAICFFVMARLQLARRVDEEQRDLALAKAERAETTIFQQEAGKFEAFTIARSREQFEKWLVPVFAAVVSVGLGFWALSLHRGLAAPADVATQRLLAASLLAGQTFALFLLSRFLLGLSRYPAQRLLRGPGVTLGIACLASLVATAAAVVAEQATPAADGIVARGLIAVLGLLAIEGVLNFIWELFRPRRSGELNCAYESRLGGLFTDPAGWVRNVGGALDYQFGFKVSETWLYRFFEGALLPLVIFQLVVLYLLSALVFLGPEEEGIVERFGKPREAAWHLDSGCHLKLPWPFETVRRFPVKRLQNVDIGFHQDEHGTPAPDTILWNVPHYQSEEQFLTASREVAGSDAVPVSLVSFNIRVEYQITNVFQYAYQFANPQRVVEQLAYRTITLTAANRGLFDVLGEGRQEMAQTLQERMQRAADALGIGIRIAYVGVQGVHPPVSVADAFQSVIGATEEKEASILKARAEANRILPLAGAEALKIETNAAAYAVRRTELSSAEADRFVKRLDSYRLSPEVFKMRLYLGSLRDSLANARKYVIAASPATEVIQLNFEDKLVPDLFDLGPTQKSKEGKTP